MYSKNAIAQNDRTLAAIAMWFWRVCIVGFGEYALWVL